MQLSFLNNNISNKSMIDGLEYIPNFITHQKQEELLKLVNENMWLNDLKRRVQHYCWKYDYKAKRTSQELYIGKLPDWLNDLAFLLHKKNIFTEAPNQVIINEYNPGQGISPHIDCINCFSEVIASISLNSGCYMDLTKPKTLEKNSIYLEPLSLLILKNEARYNWLHSITARKKDNINGQNIPRSRRISLTFRNVILTK
jgi:alkylated DNA repair dioxygenase AlkB